MKTGTDTYIQWKQEHYDQDVIKSYSSYIYHTPARKKILILTASPPLSYRIPLFLGLLYPSAIFPPPPFLGIFSKVNPPFKKRGSNYGFPVCLTVSLLVSVFMFFMKNFSHDPFWQISFRKAEPLQLTHQFAVHPF